MQTIIDTMSIVDEILRVLSAGALEIFAGAMLTEGLVLVPYWRSLTTDRFYAWYGENHQRLVGFFGPLTWVAATAALVSALTSLWLAHPSTPHTVAAAMLSLVAVALFALYFQRANASFAGASLPAEVLRKELARWARWHWVRSGVSLGALAAALERCDPYEPGQAVCLWLDSARVPSRRLMSLASVWRPVLTRSHG